MLSRRRALLGLSALLTVPTASYFYLDGINRGPSDQAPAAPLSSDEIKLIAWIADDILPPTDTPGAVDAGVPSFITMLFGDWLLPDEQTAFRDGLAGLDAQSRSRFGQAYADLPAPLRLRLLGEWDRIAAPPPALPQQASAPAPDATVPRKQPEPPFFRRLKAAVIVGYFTSEVGQNRVLKTVMGAGQNDPAGPVGGGVSFRV